MYEHLGDLRLRLNSGRSHRRFAGVGPVLAADVDLDRCMVFSWERRIYGVIAERR